MLDTRCNEHLASCIKALANGQVTDTGSHDTGLPLHVINKGHQFDFDGAKVLKIERNQRRRRFLEAIEIWKKAAKATNISRGQQLDQNWFPILDKFIRRMSAID